MINEVIKRIGNSKSKKLKLEIIATVLIFSFIMLFMFPSSEQSPITGNVVMNAPEDGQISIQELFRDDIFEDIGSGAKICINIREGAKDMFAYKVRKRGDLFNVEPADSYCDGKNKEDFVFTFENYQALVDTENDFDLDSFKSINIREDLKIWESSYVEKGGLITCNNNFKDVYCGFINENFGNKEKKLFGISCCDDVDTESPSVFGGIGNLFKKIWWLIAILVLCGALGTGAVVLLSSRDEDDEDNEETQDLLKSYIDKTQSEGFSDSSIKDKLIETGWERKDIDKAFESIRKSGLNRFYERFEKLETLNIFKRD